MALPFTFANLSIAAMSDLDDNFAALGALTPIPCTIVGTNALTLTANANTPVVGSLSNYMQFTGIAPHTNTSSVTAAVGLISPLNVYKDTPAGPVVLSGGEIIANNAITLIYDSTLNTGAGGFHLQTGASTLIGQTIAVAALILGSGATLNRLLSRQVTLTHTVMASFTTQDQTAVLTGLLATDLVEVAVPATCASVSGLVYSAYAAAAGTVAVRAANISNGAITPPSAQVFKIFGIGTTP